MGKGVKTLREYMADIKSRTLGNPDLSQYGLGVLSALEMIEHFLNEMEEDNVPPNEEK